MPKWHFTRYITLLLILVFALFWVSCSDDKDNDGGGGISDIEPSTSGEIYIQTFPKSEDINWVLYKPDGTSLAGTNSELLQDQAEGEYTLVWGEKDGYQGPSPSVVSGTLDGANNIVFTGWYDVRPGSARILFDPPGIQAEWSLNLRSAVHYTVEGTGSTVLADLPPGNYRLTVTPPEGMAADDVIGTQVANGIMTLRPVVTAQAQFLVVAPEPESLAADWSMVGPEIIPLGETSGEVFTASGQGRTIIDLPTVQREQEVASGDTTIMDTVTVTVPGEYTVTWGDVADYLTPEAVTLVHDDDDMLFAAHYGAMNGTVNVAGTQSGVDLPWALTMPSGAVIHGAGTQVLSDVPPGLYTIQGLPVDGFTPMGPVSEELPSNGAINLAVTIQPAILIEVAPLGVDAGWHLTGPDNYSLEGVGSMLVENLSAGCYSLSWDDLSGWTAPADVSNLCIDAASGGVINGEYTRAAGTFFVNVQPAGLDVDWTINGPDGFTATGTGQAALNAGAPGEYAVTWGSVDGYLQPAPEVFVYDGEGGMTIPTFYLETIGFSAVPAGTFDQGSPATESCRNASLETEHSVEMTIPFLVQTLEVTNYQFMGLVQWAYDRGYVTADRFGVFDNLDGSTRLLLDLDDGDSRIHFADGVFSCVDPHHPVGEVTWYGAAAFCDWLSMYRGRQRAYDHDSWQCGSNHPSDATGFRLPTEAEWEYAARAGSSAAYANGIGISYNYTYDSCSSSSLETIAWYGINSDASTHEVGLLVANSWGLHDMHGNVAEWVNDYMFDLYYDELYAPDTNPPGPLEGDKRVCRGGFYYSPCQDVRSAARLGVDPANASGAIGFRVVLTGE